VHDQKRKVKKEREKVMYEKKNLCNSQTVTLHLSYNADGKHYTDNRYSSVVVDLEVDWPAAIT